MDKKRKIENISEFDKLIYNKCFESKHHYDILSWTVSGAISILLVLLINWLSDFNGEIYLKIILGSIGIIICVLWFSIYERNRFWGEVANEVARDIERKYNTSGLGIEFMKKRLDGVVLLKNTDENGELYDLKIPSKPEKPFFNISMHYGIRTLIILIGSTIIFLTVNSVNSIKKLEMEGIKSDKIEYTDSRFY